MLSKSLLPRYKFEVVLFLILVFSFGVRLYRLEIPESYYFDEIYFAFTAQEMAKGNKYAWESATAPEGFAYEWTHPPLGKEISAVGILIFGDNTLGWRFFQAVFGGLGALFIYLLAENLFQSKGAGLIASMLYSFDSFLFVLSRITMVDIFMADFLLLASLFIVKYARTRSNVHLMLTGLFCGAAMSIKWSGVYVWEYLAAVAFLLIYHYEVYTADTRGKSFVISLLNIAPRMILAFGVIPLLVYLASYLPFFYHGNSLSDLINLQINMYGYHGGVTEDHPYQSAWWQWPLLLRTVFLYLDDLGNGFLANIYLIGNPFIWWTGLMFFALGVIQVVRRETPALLFAVVSVLAYWLPWALSPRKLVFLYHFTPSFLFILLISAYFLDRLWSVSGKGKLIVAVYLVLAAGTFIYFYPILAAVPVEEGAMGHYMWLGSWR